MRNLTLPALWLAIASLGALAQDDVADIASEKIAIEKDEKKSYFFIGPLKDDKAPKEGFGLVVIMPGGNGSAEFNGFVRRIFKNALGAGWIAAQPISVKWTEEQQIIWPTDKSRVAKQKFTTEEFVEAAIKDAGTRQKINPAKVFTLSWSSSGPAAYAISMRPKSPVKGSFVAMSVFKPATLPPLDAAKGHAYYLYHSKEDAVCAYSDAESALAQLKEKGAAITLKTFAGGHGWSGNVYGDIREGFEWLAKNTGKGK